MTIEPHTLARDWFPLFVVQRKFNLQSFLEKIPAMPVVTGTRRQEPTKAAIAGSNKRAAIKEHIMGSKFHATCAAVFLASAMGFAGTGLAATTASDSGSGRDSIDIVKNAVGDAKTSTSNRAANRNRATRARVERNEAEITRKLNSAIAENAGTPSGAPQAAIPRPASPTINETGAPVGSLPPPRAEPAPPTVGEPGTAALEGPGADAALPPPADLPPPAARP